MADITVAAEYGACVVCRVSVPKQLLAKQRGRCDAHVDATVEERPGCPECGADVGHYRNCAWCE